MLAEITFHMHAVRARRTHRRIGLMLMVQGLLLVSPVGTAVAGEPLEPIFDNGLPEGSAGFFADVNNDQVIADDFMLATMETASTIRWFGSYVGDEPGAPERFIVRYHDDDGGEPALDPFLVVDEFVTRQGTGTSTNSGRPIFVYETDGPGSLLAGTLYWVTIQKQDTGDPDYLWLASDPFAGNALFQFQGGTWETLGVEQAFSLLPEPGFGVSAVAALLTLVGYRRLSAPRSVANKRTRP